MSALDKEVYRLNAQKEKLEESMENQVNYMWNEYELTLRDAAQLRDETMNDLAEMKKQTQTIKEAIRRLGDVNVNAIEDYKNLMERYTFLKAQHDDLVEAEKTLERIIVELDEAMPEGSLRRSLQRSVRSSIRYLKSFSAAARVRWS